MSAGRTAIVVLAALVLQVCLFSRFSFDGARPDVMLLIAVMGGLTLGPERGAIVGFAAGMSFDALLTTPFGLSALIYTVVGYGVGVACAGLVRTSRIAAPAVAAAGSAVGVILYALVGAVLGEATLDGAPLGTIVIYVAVINAVLAPVAARALAWVGPADRDRRQPFALR